MDEQMVRKKLIEYLPQFMQNFSELKELLRVVNIETDSINILIQKILDEAFIEDCTEYGLRKYENFLHIIPADGESLETRRSRVLLYWDNSVPYSYRNLIRQLNNYCGADNYDIDQVNYLVSLSVYGKTDISVIREFLEKVLPENILYEVWHTAGFEGFSRTGIVWQDDEIFTLRQVVI